MIFGTDCHGGDSDDDIVDNRNANGRTTIPVISNELE